MNGHPLRALVLAAAVTAWTAAAADDGGELRNWFGDPFFAVSSAIADCPRPAGPFVDAHERAVQAHHRAERGTTCWLAGQCEKPNAYAYDRGIAEAVQRRIAGRAELDGSSLWVTVQGRVVYLEGCASTAAQVDALEALLRAVPQVQQVLTIVRVGAGARVPYRRFEP